MNPIVRTSLALILTAFAARCSSEEPPPPVTSNEPPEDVHADDPWTWVAKAPGAALLSVHGTSAKDVWLSGADDGAGPVVLHFDGKAWARRPTGTRGDLWWVHALEDGPVFFGGSDAMLLRYQGGEFTRIPTAGLGKDTVYGVWAASAKDVYAVGASTGRNGFIWHYDGEEVSSVPLPEGLPEDELNDLPGLFKVWGTNAKDVWIVGARGLVLRGNAKSGFELVRAGGDDTLFTIAARGDQVAAVGGASAGRLFELTDDELEDHTPKRAPLLQGVDIAEDGSVWAVGVGGAIYRGSKDQFKAIDPGLDFAAAESLHAVWTDPSGGVWAVGGDVLTPELDQGLALHRGAKVPLTHVDPMPPPAAICPTAVIDPEPDASIARRWDEQILNAIRRDIPRPTVHARNLFHLSIAFWDAYASYTPEVSGYLNTEKVSTDADESEIEEALSFAAYRILSHRYSKAIGGVVSQACFDAFMDALGYDPAATDTAGDEPHAVGNRIAKTIIDEFDEDGANEQADYSDPDEYTTDNASCVVDRPGAHATNPLVWQPLVLAKAETQNGIPAGAGAQPYIGSHWGSVAPFGLERAEAGAPYLDIGTAPTTLDDSLVDASLEVLRRSSELDVTDETLVDVSPLSMGNNPLGSNAGEGRKENPITGEAYEPLRVRRSDFGRVLAEFWADGPTSETPPGHWNTIANQVADSEGFERKLYGEGGELGELDWDVRVYLTLNGALHDAAIAAWELKRVYTTARPITLIRTMAEHGQRTDPDAASYDPKGLPLVPGLIELISEDSTRDGERHAHLRRYVGEVAIKAWRGEPGDRKKEVGGVTFIRALEWIPYQRRTFVTPAFPGYTSGHSTFSRAAAEVMAALTGSEFFPGGLARQVFEPGYLFFEAGPSEPIELQWATYYDAADQAGQSRVWGGIHVQQDDFDGRRVGSRVGALALEKVRAYFEPSE